MSPEASSTTAPNGGDAVAPVPAPSRVSGSGQGAQGGAQPAVAASKREAAPLEFLRAALVRTKAGQAKTHVLFFGDSHVAADFMSGRVRERLQVDYGDGGPGFLMTGQPWRSYRHDRAELLDARGLQVLLIAVVSTVIVRLVGK
jgi:hypothetical protein